MKRITSLLCAAVLGISGIAAAFPENLTVLAEEVNEATSGECGYWGDNITWSFSNGTLALKGSGKMDYNYYNNPEYVPWHPLRDKITKVVFGEGITDTGDNTFCGCDNLTSVTLSSTIEEIEWYTFSGCTSLKSIIIPESVISIGFHAFAGCTSLTDIILPDVTFDENGKEYSSITFGEGVFSGCISLSNAMAEYILKHMVSIPWNAFSDCLGLTSIIIPDCVKSLGLYMFNGCKNLETLILPNGIETIQEYALEGIGVFKLTIPEGVTTIEQRTFANCPNLTILALPRSLKRIGLYATDNSYNLKDVYYAGTEDEWNSISNDDFRALEQATIHYESQTVPDVISIPTPYDGKLGVKWGSEIFKDKSNQYHQDLAMLGIALSTASYDKDEKDNTGFYIQQAFRDAMKCTDYRLYSYPNAGICNNPNNVSGFSDADLAFSIAHAKLGDNTVLFVALRGTHTPMEWYYDIKESGLDAPDYYHGLSAASGFVRFAEDVERGIEDYLSDHSSLKSLASSGKLKVFITGHSLGAAGANLFAYAVNTGVSPLGKINPANVFAYTFATPNTVFKDTVTMKTMELTDNAENIFNICNLRDIVTTVPSVCINVSNVGAIGAKLGRGYIFDSGWKDSAIEIREGEYLDTLLGFNGHHCGKYINAVKNNFLDPDNTERVYVRCPVDVEIYRGNELVGRTVNNIVDEEVTTIPLAVVDDEKVFYLPGDAVYDVRLTTFDEGTMDFIAVSGNNSVTAAKSCENIALTEGKEMNWMMREGATAAVTPLLVIDENGLPVKKILSDGSEADFTANLAGDVSNDGEFNVADVVLFQKYMLSLPDGALGHWQLGDFNEDGILNAVDLTLMKRFLLND